MSLRTRIHGFTAWVNLRLKSFNDTLLSNVYMDLLSGTHMKALVESMTGRDMKTLQSFDGLTQQQRITRAEWIVTELKTCKLIPKDVYVDTRLVAMRSSDHVFEFLWRLISHDIWFVWERAEYLQTEDDKVLTEVPFKWIPEPPPKKKKKYKTKQSLLSGFGSSATKREEVTEESPSPFDADYEPFPGSDYCKQFKAARRNPDDYPAPDDCILEIVNTHLHMTWEGRRLRVVSIDDLVDSRVLCALVNSIIPDTFTTEVLLNDRWTINLCLRTAEKMFYGETPFDSADLVEADSMSVCSYFCYFFMIAYKYRQCKAVINRRKTLLQLIRECILQLEEFPPVVVNMQDLKKKKDIKQDMENHKEAVKVLETKFDVEYCQSWIDHVQLVQKQVHQKIRERIALRFDTMEVPRNLTINDLCLSMVINLNLTNGSGFYLSTDKEMCSEGRKIILRNKETGEYIDDFTAKNKTPMRKILKLRLFDVVEVNPALYPQYDVFFESPSRNKQLKAGTEFLYQVFPGNHIAWHRIFVRAAKDEEFETIRRMVVFFRTSPSFINGKEPSTGSTALHWACRVGNFKMVEYLLENGANIDIKNNFRYTPLFSSIEGMQRKIAHLLIEWGCDVHGRSVRGQTAFESIKNDEFRQYLSDMYDHYSSIVPRIMEGDRTLLEQVVKEHASGEREFCSLRSRCINGSTLLHTSAYFGVHSVLRLLLTKKLDVNLFDYKGATPIHRAKDVTSMKILLDAGARVNIEDSEGNTPLHVKCYGENGKPSDIGCIDLLVGQGANLVARNNRGLMPIHCCAMQGRVDAIGRILRADKDEGAILKALESEDVRTPPSLVHLAVANDFLHCANWLVSNGFSFKDGEPDLLVQRIIMEQIKIKHQGDCMKFLLDSGANPNPRYFGGNSALHYAASMQGSTEVLELLLAYGADIDAFNNEHNTALFFATQSNNQFAASVLISNGANYRCRNLQGVSAFDVVQDFDEWLECGYFSEEIKARLKAYSLKHARDLIRAISRKVKPPVVSRGGLNQSSMALMSRFTTQQTQMALQNNRSSYPAITDGRPTYDRMRSLPTLTMGKQLSAITYR